MNDGAKNFDRARGIVRQRVGHTWPARELRSAISEHFRSGVWPGEGGNHSLQLLSLQNARGLFPHCGIGIGGKNAQRLDTVFRRKSGYLATNRKLAFQGRLAGPDFLL